MYPILILYDAWFDRAVAQLWDLGPTKNTDTHHVAWPLAEGKPPDDKTPFLHVKMRRGAVY